MAERCRGILHVNYPEMFDPYEYQSDEKYIALQVAETIMSDVFKKFDTNFRMPYDSKMFNLPDLMYYLGSSNIDECLRQFGNELNR